MPPIFSVPVVPFPLVNVPAPDRLVLAVIVPEFVRLPVMIRPVLTVSVPEFVRLPEIVTLPIEVTVEPLIVFVVPLKVCIPVPKALNVVALFVKLPPKL